MKILEDNLDYYPQANALRDVNSYLKFILGMGAILICVVSPGPVAPLFILFTLSAITMVFAKIPVRVYAELLLIPLTFAVLSVIVILFLSGGGDPILTFSNRRYTANCHNRLRKPCASCSCPDLWRDVRALLYCPDDPHD